MKHFTYIDAIERCDGEVGLLIKKQRADLVEANKLVEYYKKIATNSKSNYQTLVIVYGAISESKAESPIEALRMVFARKIVESWSDLSTNDLMEIVLDGMDKLSNEEAMAKLNMLTREDAEVYINEIVENYNEG